MCSQYTLKLSRTDGGESSGNILSQLGAYDSTFRPSTTAPVVVLQNGQSKITPMRFSLIPHWSIEPKVKFATHNARIESISEKPTWKLPFVSQHCLVPVSSFYESVYEGPLAGHIIKFSGENDQALWAAGVFDCWKDTGLEKKSASPPIFSFSILTW